MQGIHLRKYGVETIINFELYEIDGVDLRIDAADAGSDCTIRKDQGADATCVNDFVDEGLSYSITITATEMQAKCITLHIIDSATKVWLDKVIEIETYGHASAQHAFDLDAASVAQTADNETRLATIETDTGTTLDALIKDIPTVAEFEARSDVAGTAATPAEVATALGTYDAPTKAEMDTAHALLATVAKQDVIDSIVDSILLDTGTDGVVLKAAGLADDAVAEFWAKAMVDLAAVPAGTASVFDAINWMFEVSRNRMLTDKTDGEVRLYKDNATTVFAESTVSDDADHFDREEFRAP